MDSQVRVWYHEDCPDGFTAAWVCWRLFPTAAFAPVRYGDAMPPAGQHDSVVIVDFSFPRESMIGLAGRVAELTVLDHHKTAQADCAGLPFCQFDMERSGAGMAWDHFFSGKPRPWLVDYVEDRDLWRFALPESRAVNALVRSSEQTWENWTGMCGLYLEEAARQGVGCQKHIDACVRAAVRHAFMARLGQTRLPLVNITYESCSEVADALCQRGYPIAGYWFERGDGKIQYGLRARGDADCSELARRYGGGGHKGASGFVVDAPVHQRVDESLRSEV